MHSVCLVDSLNASTRTPTVPSLLILLIWTVLWSALVRRYHVPARFQVLACCSLVIERQALLTSVFVVEHASVRVGIIARWEMSLC
jgi:hypothetical protein